MFSSARGSRRLWRPAALSIVALAAGGWSAQPASAGTLARALDHLATVQDPRGGGFAEGRISSSKIHLKFMNYQKSSMMVVAW
jgi:hypothetical protein